MTVAPSTYRFGPFTVESTSYRLLKQGTVVQVSPKVIDLLLYLVARPSLLVTKEELFSALGPDVAVTDNALTQAVNPALAEAQAAAPVVVAADPADCSFQFDLLSRNPFDRHSCDLAKAFLKDSGVSYASEDVAAGSTATMRVGDHAIAAPDPSGSWQILSTHASWQDDRYADNTPATGSLP